MVLLLHISKRADVHAQIASHYTFNFKLPGNALILESFHAIQPKFL